jgi:hypothetical protein
MASQMSRYRGNGRRRVIMEHRIKFLFGGGYEP